MCIVGIICVYFCIHLVKSLINCNRAIVCHGGRIYDIIPYFCILPNGW